MSPEFINVFVFQNWPKISFAKSRHNPAFYIKGWVRGRRTRIQSHPKVHFNFSYCYLNF